MGSVQFVLVRVEGKVFHVEHPILWDKKLVFYLDLGVFLRSYRRRIACYRG